MKIQDKENSQDYWLKFILETKWHLSRPE